MTQGSSGGAPDGGDNFIFQVLQTHLFKEHPFLPEELPLREGHPTKHRLFAPRAGRQGGVRTGFSWFGLAKCCFPPPSGCQWALTVLIESKWLKVTEKDSDWNYWKSIGWKWLKSTGEANELP